MEVLKSSCNGGGSGGSPSVAVARSCYDAGPDPVVVVLTDHNWKYRGEGGANLVISLPKQKKVVRFAKSKYAGKDQDAKIGEIAYFTNEVMRPLIGPHFVRPVCIGVVSDRDFERVRLDAEPFRPTHRCKKVINSKRVILSPDCVFLTPELEPGTFGDTFSVEIKPKQGWHSLKATCSVDLCHRCIKQYAKFAMGEIDTVSKYCPLDLFSGDKHRMKKAIFDLFENPCNRFKLFKNGDLVYTNGVGTVRDLEEEMKDAFGRDESENHQGSSSLDLLAALLCSALLTPMPATNDNDESSGVFPVMEDLIDLSPTLCSVPRSGCCDTKSLPLPKNSILQRILTLQKHMEISDHEAKQLCDKLLNNIEDIEGLHQLVLWHPNVKLARQLSPSDIDNVLQLQRFLLSVTAKDVSVLITFREMSSPNLQQQQQDSVFHFRAVDKYFRVMISVIDLDPKSVHNISKWIANREDYLRICRDVDTTINK